MCNGNGNDLNLFNKEIIKFSCKGSSSRNWVPMSIDSYYLNVRHFFFIIWKNLALIEYYKPAFEDKKKCKIIEWGRGIFKNVFY